MTSGQVHDEDVNLVIEAIKIKEEKCEEDYIEDEDFPVTNYEEASTSNADDDKGDKRPSSPGYYQMKQQDADKIKWILACKYCEFSTERRVDMKRHMILHNGLSHKQIGPFLSDDLVGQLNYRKTKTDDRKFQCSQCLYKAIQKVHLDLHVRTRHYGERPFACDQCDYRAAQKVSLERHIKGRHTKEKPFSCPYCDYKTVQKVNLNRHVISKHVEGETLSCPYCAHTAKLKVRLDQHIKQVHNDDPKYVCESCNFVTDDPDDLQIHACQGYITTQLRSKRKHFCDLCQYSTANKAALGRHKRRDHSESCGQVCVHCYQTFETSKLLKRHILNVHTPGVHKCDWCSFSSKKFRNLEEHILESHSLERPLQCDFCDFATTQITRLHAHKNKRHAQIKNEIIVKSEDIIPPSLKKSKKVEKVKLEDMIECIIEDVEEIEAVDVYIT